MMKKMALIIQKELRSLFSSPLAYILLGLFSILSGILFSNTLQTYLSQIQILSMEEQQQISFVQEVVYRFFGNLHFLLLFYTPLLTMKLLSEEKKQKTMDLLWMAPISELEIVLGKFLASLIFFMSFLAVTLIYPFLLLDAGMSDYFAFLLGYLALFLTGACYLSVGLLCSAFTDNAMVAAVSTFVALMLIWLLNWVGQLSQEFIVREILNFVALGTHFENIAQGNLNLSSIVFNLSFVFLALFTTVKYQESRHW